MTTRSYLLSITLISSLGGLVFGFGTGVISGALLFIKSQYHPSAMASGLIVSSLILGGFLGAISSGRAADELGRRHLIIIGSLIFNIGTCFAILAHSIDQIIMARFLAGGGIGIVAYVIPLYIAEISPAEIRGRFVLINAVMITGGEALAFLTDYWLVDTQSWRFMFAVSLVPGVLLYLGSFLLPETPRWLFKRGKAQRAIALLKKLQQAEKVDHDIDAIEGVVDKSDNPERAFWGTSSLWSILTIGILLGVLQQGYGINVLMYYGPFLFQQAGFHSSHESMLATFILGAVNTVMSLMTLLLVDTIGRRQLLLTGSLLASVSMIALGDSIEGSTSVTGLSHWMALFSAITFICGYCMSIGSLFWLLIAELFPLKLRGQAMGLASAAQWGMNSLVSLSFMPFINRFGPSRVFWLFASICLLSHVFFYYWVPETQGKTLEEIEHEL